MRTLNEVRKTWDTREAFLADMQNLDTATLGPLKFNGTEATDFVGVRNERSGRVVGAMKGGYVLRNAPDLADMALRAFEGAGGVFAGADYWASDAQHYIGIFGAEKTFKGGDTLSLGFGVRNSFDGSLKVMAGGIAERPACENAMIRAFKDAEAAGTVVGAKHTAKPLADLEDRFFALAESENRAMVEFGHLLTVARDFKVDPLAVRDTLKPHFGARAVEGIAALVPRYVAGREGSDPFATDEVSRWSLYQAATDYFSHHEGASSQQARQAGAMKAEALLAVVR